MFVAAFLVYDAKRRCFPHGKMEPSDVAAIPSPPRKFEVDYLIQRVEAQIARSSGALPTSAIDEYRAALKAYRAVAETAR